MKIKRFSAALAAAAILCTPAAMAQDNESGDSSASADIPEPAQSEKSGSVRIGGQTINYDVVAGETYLKNDKGEPVASIFSTSYIRKNGDRSRPVLFVFNGGPGSASLWLHMGVFGPKRVVIPSDGSDDGAPPYDLGDNPYSMLDVADMVFIDPVGTGWSRALGDTDPKDYYGLEEDADSLGRFIRLWLTENGRWNSPKYLAGESYGTTRAAALIDELQGGWTDVSLNGVILISAVLDFQFSRYGKGNEMVHVSYIPSFAAIAWYHGKIDKSAWNNDFDAFTEATREFAIEEYAPALLKGAMLEDSRRREIITKLSGFTGLSETYLRQANMRVNNMRFMKELLRDEQRSTGRLDARYTGIDFDAAGERFDADPSSYGIDGAYTAAVNDYLTRELDVPITRDYRVLDGEPGSNWNWSAKDSGGWPAYVNVGPWISEGMRQNSELRIMLASGWYDLATPVFGAELALQRDDIPQDRITKTYYQSGHMMYVHQPSLEQLSEDMHDFVAAGSR
ncbi:MAG: peptidase S10 [Euryhalocaulis sp.]|uniref:S10 family peptidase n=1 Tax=Euryhalocaulis sp. TaxID=2744307 RepID=UPI001849E1C4|nr:peptidase S10 [Euryhalocaulis sp.]MBA4800538.1 peptidase S10 [Euryhalocaulis sp.]